MIETTVLPTLKPEVKELWTAALDSGEFKQGTGRLRSDILEVASYCCYGVLCEVYRRTTGEGKWIKTSSGAMSFKPNDDAMAMIGLPPPLVLDWAFTGGDTEFATDVNVVINSCRDRLHMHNDKNEKTFTEISAAIKEQL